MNTVTNCYNIHSKLVNRPLINFLLDPEFDDRFDVGEDIAPVLDLSKSRRVLQTQKRVNLDFPIRIIESLDREASKLG